MGGERRKLPKLKRRKLAQLKAKLPQVEIGGCKVHRINLKKTSGTLGLGSQAQGTLILSRARTETWIKVQERR